MLNFVCYRNVVRIIVKAEKVRKWDTQVGGRAMLL